MEKDAALISNIEFLKKIRTSGNTIPFIIFTGKGREEVVIQALNDGADFYLQKGGEPKSQFAELSHKIRQSIQQRKAEINIRDLVRRETDIINFLPDATFAIDTRGVVIAWNRAMEKMTGIKAAEILGKGDYEYALPFYRERSPILIDLVLWDNPATTVKYQNVIRDQKNLISEVTIPHFNNGKGEYLWEIASQLYDTRGDIIGAIESIREITDRKRAEESLKSSEERYRTLLQRSFDAVVVHRNGIITLANQGAATLIGASSPSELIGKKVLDFVHPAYRDTVQERIAAMTREDVMTAVDAIEEKFMRIDGKAIDVEVVATGFLDEGQPAIQVVFRDITRRKGLMEALKEREERYHAFFTTSMDCVFITSVDGRWLDFNDLAIHFFGYASRDELQKVNVKELYENPIERKNHVAFIKEKGYSKEYPVNLKKKDGTIINTLITAVPIKDNTGTVIGFQGTIRDITES